jgi:hypothetical protein
VSVIQKTTKRDDTNNNKKRLFIAAQHNPAQYGKHQCPDYVGIGDIGVPIQLFDNRNVVQLSDE